MPTEIGFLIFPDVQQLDFTGPYEVLGSLGDVRLHVVALDAGRILSSTGLTLTPTVTAAACPPLDVLCIPGGKGIDALLRDERALAFVRRRAADAKYVTSVCTGALLLGAAGLLRGRRATTHWQSLELLALYGATPVRERVVRDGNLITGGGVTAGIDFGLSLAAELAGVAEAQAVQLGLEYAPDPPFDAGDPRTAPPEVLKRFNDRTADHRAARLELVQASAQAVAE